MVYNNAENALVSDTSLIARKYEHDWTRLDGPYLWFRPDQLNGEVVYRATVKFQAAEIVIEAERNIERRGAVKRVRRPADYDPRKMTAFNPDVDATAVPPDPLSVEPAGIAEQFNGLKWPAPYFSSAFRAWCADGRWTSGRTEDGRTWVFVDADAPRKGARVRVRRRPLAFRNRRLPLQKVAAGYFEFKLEMLRLRSDCIVALGSAVTSGSNHDPR